MPGTGSAAGRGTRSSTGGMFERANPSSMGGTSSLGRGSGIRSQWGLSAPGGRLGMPRSAPAASSTGGMSGMAGR
jgi:hypothetical protein